MMRSYLLSLMSKLLLFACIGTAMTAVLYANSTVIGKVKDDSGKPLSQHPIRIIRAGQKGEATKNYYGITDSSGVYSFRDMPPATYEIQSALDSSVRAIVDVSVENGEITVPDLIYRTPAGLQLLVAAHKTGRQFKPGYEEYRFDLSVRVPPNEISEISKVTYDLVYTPNPLTISSEIKPAFSVQYVGWGCYETVIVRARRASGDATYRFDMCSLLKWH